MYAFKNNVTTLTKERVMNFIESIFGLAPDGGSGLWEWAIVIAIVALISVRVQQRRPGRAPQR